MSRNVCRTGLFIAALVGSVILGGVRRAAVLGTACQREIGGGNTVTIRLALCAAMAGAALVSTTSGGELATLLQPIIDQHNGNVAVAVKHLKSGESFEHNAAQPMPTASMIKFPLLVATYQAIDEGRLQLNTMITLREEDKVPGSGILTSHFSSGVQLSLRDAMQLMVVFSDNTATNLVIDQTGLDATAKLMEQLGCPNTKLHSKVFRRDTSIFPERSREFGLGSTTAAEMVKLLELLGNRRLINAERSEQMLAHLYDCNDRSKIARFLPDDVKFAHKGGSVSASRVDAGLIDSARGMIALCVMTTDNADRSWNDDNAANLLAGRIGEAVYRHFNPGTPGESAPPPVMKIGASGLVVEGLQRTLNVRLKPSHDLGVDGDFGPATERAVIAFQKANGLPGTGELDGKTWEALGPLVAEDEVPEPAEVNDAPVEKQPADELVGRPFVTAKSWAIGDGETGELLWGENATESRDMASTTKIMTAYTVLKMADQYPGALDETLVYSTNADETIGSTTNIRAGERLTVRATLFGLLLPSGNDASVALAEHFGGKLVGSPSEDESPTPKEAYERFVEVMNGAAEELGMTASNFKNTHGLTEVDHRTSAVDLMKLAAASMKYPLFREIVSTPKFGCTVVGQGGYRRNVVFRNTNRLLGIEGYDGVKTGTTNAAGACLVAHGHRGERLLFVVVLGSSSSDTRYADARNLFRWAWNQLGAR